MTLTPVVSVRTSDAEALAIGVAFGVMTGLVLLAAEPSAAAALFATVLLAVVGGIELFDMGG